MHETKSHRYNTWLTLTYDDEHLPRRYNTGAVNPKTGKPIYSGSLDKSHMQLFYRKLRKALCSKGIINDYRILFEYYTDAAHMGLRPIPRLKYYYAGEYGEKYGRPHYHACLFGIDFNDKKHIATTRDNFKLYESKRLQELWPHGTCTIGELNWQTAAYTARYIMKKITGKNKNKHYEKIDHDTGEIIPIEPEFNDMSRKPGIGKNHYDQFKNDIYKEKTSHVRVKGKKTKPPRYYDKLHARHFPEHIEQIKFERQLNARLHWRNYTTPRLRAQEIITNAAIKTLKQKL